MKVFISYRRDDSAGYAGRLFEHLTARFGTQNVFMDIDTIEPGEDFRKVVQDAVGTCDVVLVMIGKQWLKMTDARGQRRLDDPRDWVRVEIASALANPRVRVIPVLVREAVMPDIHELPDDLKELSWRNAMQLSDHRFQYDVNELIEVIERAGTRPKKPLSGRIPNISRGRFWGIVLGLFGLGLVIWMLGSGIVPLTIFKTSTPTDLAISTSVPNSYSASQPSVSTNELQLIRTIPSSGEISSAALSPDGQIVAVGSYGGTIKLWSTSEDTLLGTLNAGTTVLSLALSNDNQLLAAGLSNSVVKVMRLSDGMLLTLLEGLPSEVYSVAFSLDGQMVAAGAAPNIMIWRVSDGVLLHNFEEQPARIDSLSFSSDGELLASGAYYSTAKLWQLNDGTLLHDLEAGGLGIVAFSPIDAEILATSGNGSSAYLRRVRDGALLHELAGHTQVIESIAFSSDGQSLVSVSNDIEVRRWQVSDGKRQYTWTMDGQNVHITSLSADGRVLMAAYFDGTVKLWQLP